MAPSAIEPNVFKICIVGAGPAGLYAADALLQSGAPCEIDVLERLPVPFGLVRFGVAPDHHRLKAVGGTLAEVLKDARCRFVGNAAIDRDVDIETLRALYDVVIVATGAPYDRSLGIPGENLPGSHAGGEFIAWYNGHPDGHGANFDLDHDTAVVVGHGNVAADIARILSKPVDELRATDISEQALESLSRSRIKRVHIVGRRGPAQAKFTTKELRELGTLTDCSCHIAMSEMAMTSACLEELASPAGHTPRANNLHFQKMSEVRTAASKRIDIRFHLSPRRLEGQDRVERILFDRTVLSGAAFDQRPRATGETEAIACGLVFRSIGFQGKPFAGLPFDQARGVLPNVRGRVMKDGMPSDVYVAGWLKRGASGIIGTNRACSVETVAAVTSDLEKLRPGGKPGFRALRAGLDKRGIDLIDFSDWLRIDEAEKSLGLAKGKPREKFTTVREMLDLVGRRDDGAPDKGFSNAAE